MIWIRATFPRLRYDQLMSFGWKKMLPLAVLNFIVLAIVLVMAQEGAFDPLKQAVSGLFG
jgi:NADH-quinone oxidoreductase subunit H